MNLVNFNLIKVILWWKKHVYENWVISLSKKKAMTQGFMYDLN